MDEEKRERAREATRKWRKANPDKVRESNRKAYAKNREKKIARVIQWQKDNPERYKARMDEWRKNNRERINEKQRENYLQRLYGISNEERDSILENQGGCGVCKRHRPDSRGWVVDHCHTTGFVRGVLCHPCNLLLGQARDRVQILRQMIDYLER